MTDTFDPTAPLPAPPDPWADYDMPSHRDAPPYHMTDMIAAEPHLARRLLARLASSTSAAAALAEAVRETVARGAPVVFVGCGTSEHAAMAAADILGEALRDDGTATPGSVLAIEAFEASLRPLGTGLVVGISHEGGTAATRAALERARAAGTRTAVITAGAGSPAAALADIVVATGEMDQSYCHTVGYVSPLLAATVTATHLTNSTLDAEMVADLMTGGTQDTEAETIAASVGTADHVLVTASGADRAAARELAIKIEEASWLPTTMRDLETLLHGHLPSTDASTGLVLILTDRDHRAERLARARDALASARVIGLPAAAIVAADAARSIPEDMTPAGRIVVPEEPALPSAIAALLASAIPLQLITERIARVRGTNPDPIRRDDPTYREAASVSGT
jgi:glucosamine--fructose-6-phosphate aminotransferase (isomerizing)